MVLSSTSSFTALPRSRPLPPLVESHVVERTNSNETLSGPQLEVDLSSVVSNIHSLDSITVLGATASVPPHITVPTVPIVSTTPNLPPQVVNHWTFWRLWCVVHGVFTLIIFSVEVVGLLDSTTCDSRIYNFTLAYAFILALNCLLSLLLFFILPKAPIWTHQNYLKAKLSTWVFTLQVVGIMSQLVMVPLGFAFMTKSDQTCRDTLLYRSNYGVLLGEIILFTLLTSPIFYVPCFLILTDIPPFVLRINCRDLSR